MDAVGPTLAASVAGLTGAERVAARDKAKENKRIDDRFKRSLDQAELTVTGVEEAEAVRKLKGNDQEEAHEDHQAALLYEAEQLAMQQAKLHQPRLDIEG